MSSENVSVMLGNPKFAITSMTVPILISLVVSQANTFVDMFWCSTLGDDALAAVGMVSSLYWLIAGIGNGIGIGVSASAAFNIGSGNKAAADSIITQAFVFMILVSVLITPVLLILNGPLVNLIGGGMVYEEAVAYTTPFIILTIAIIMQGVFAGILRAEGAAKRSMNMMLSCAVFNMILDPVFLFVFDWGIAGLSYALVIASLLSMIPFFYWYFIKKDSYLKITLKKFRFRREYISAFLKVGFPKMIELNIMSLFNLLFVHFLVLCGGVAGTALYNTAWRYVALLLIPSQAVAASVVSVCSASYGTNDFQKLKAGYNYALWISVIISTIGSALVVLLAEPCAALFTHTEDTLYLREDLTNVIRIFCVFIPFYAWINVASSLLQSLQMSSSSLYSALIRNIILTMAFWITSSMTLYDMWWSLVLCEIFGGFLMGIWALHGLNLRRSERTVVKSHLIN